MSTKSKYNVAYQLSSLFNIDLQENMSDFYGHSFGFQYVKSTSEELKKQKNPRNFYDFSDGTFHWNSDCKNNTDVLRDILKQTSFYKDDFIADRKNNKFVCFNKWIKDSEKSVFIAKQEEVKILTFEEMVIALQKLVTQTDLINKHTLANTDKIDLLADVIDNNFAMLRSCEKKKEETLD